VCGPAAWGEGDPERCRFFRRSSAAKVITSHIGTHPVDEVIAATDARLEIDPALLEAPMRS
jgi:hypothetical protein